MQNPAQEVEANNSPSKWESNISESKQLGNTKIKRFVKISKKCP